MPAFSVKKETSSFSLLYRILDLSLFVVSSLIAYYIYFDNIILPQHYLFAISTASFISIVVFSSFSLHKTWRGSLLRNEFKQIILSWGSIFLILTMLVFVTKTNDYFSRGWYVIWFVLGLSLDLIFRGIIRKYLSFIRREGRNHRDIVIVAGDGNMGANVCDILSKQKWTGLNVVAYFADNIKNRPLKSSSVYTEKISNLIDFLKNNTVYQVWITLPLSAEKDVKEILHSLRFYSGDIKYIPDFYGFNLINHSFSEIAGIPIINMTESPFSGSTRLIKRTQDIFVSIFILIFISPVMLLICIAVKMTSKGAIFYKQERVSWNNKTFTMFKYRTMPIDVEHKTGAVWAKKGEKRTTIVGSFLRKTSLDELPQFVNVLMGDMSIVGPRPERPIFVEQFKEEIPQYMKKHMVKAGITGWAQINGLRGNSNLQKRIEYDIYYIEHWSFALDIKIIILTIFKGFVHKNAY